MKKVITILMTLCLLLTGCSSGSKNPDGDVTVKWQAGQIFFGSKTLPIVTYSGYEATISDGVYQYDLSIDEVKDLTMLSVNTQGIEEINMDKYKGMFGYGEYLGTKYTLVRKVADGLCYVCQVSSSNMDEAIVQTKMAGYLEDIVLTNGQVYCQFGDEFVFGNDYDVVTVRADGAVISGIAKVTAGTKAECNTPYMVTQGKKEYQLMKYSTSKYDYYSYNGYLIQLAAGMSIESYITFK